MILRQFLHKDPVAISYFAACGTHAAAAVVDPIGEIAPYLRVAEEAGTRIRYVVSAQRLKTLPDHLEVLPGAYAGSVCGRSLSGKPMSTIGFEKRHNKALRIADEEEFVRAMLADLPPAPPQAAQIRAANSGFAEAAE